MPVTTVTTVVQLDEAATLQVQAGTSQTHCHLPPGIPGISILKKL